LKFFEPVANVQTKQFELFQKLCVVVVIYRCVIAAVVEFTCITAHKWQEAAGWQWFLDKVAFFFANQALCGNNAKKTKDAPTSAYVLPKVS
jgi:hypothetical protein